ncbi:MAG TPA: 16S rRNA (cytosine(1402)-N(4))-methyltransferase RsmH [Candidatus Krumholzibacteria bacterium]|nr:16S rRNA (cytosine(1402)-N(4))-methyltransferase RsmH [Candidatus Krumholzibacteria bacterium]
MSRERHVPVMVAEVLQYLLHEHSRLIVDGTLGFGGHAEAILGAQPDISLIGIDRDPAAIAASTERLAAFGNRVRLVQGVYSDLAAVLPDGVNADGVLLDLGISSAQIDERERGFAHAHSGPLDMRMSGAGETAAQLIARTDLDALTGWLRELGEVRQPRRVARAILRARDEGRLATTGDLRAAVEGAIGRGAAPAELSRVFQSLRIAVNDELSHLRRFLDGVLGRLNPGGRLVIISYHSLEDRMVKQFMRDASAACVCPPEVPVCVCGRTPQIRMLTRRAQGPRDQEIARNPRSRSAHLRAAEKVVDDAA